MFSVPSVMLLNKGKGEYVGSGIIPAPMARTLWDFDGGGRLGQGPSGTSCSDC